MWFDNNLLSRLNSQEKGRIVIVTPCLHMDDLVGHLLEKAAGASSLPGDRRRGRAECFRYTRKAGEVLDPARFSRAALDEVRRAVGPYNFAGNVMSGRRPRTVGKNAYLLHVLRKRMDYPDLKRAVRDQKQLHNAHLVLIEDKASGTQLIQELIREGLHAVQRYTPQLDKIMRLHAQTAMIENGFVYLPQAAPWLDGYLQELTAFPRGKHDDQTDSTSQFLDWHCHIGRWVTRRCARSRMSGTKNCCFEPRSVSVVPEG